MTALAPPRLTELSQNLLLPGTERGDVQGKLETVRNPSESIVVNMGKEEHECVRKGRPDSWF
jgi:hypothetical protein